MPRKDPVARNEYMNAWRKKAIKQGYGKAIYARRQRIYENERILRGGLEAIVQEMQRALRSTRLDERDKKAFRKVREDMSALLAAAPVPETASAYWHKKDKKEGKDAD